MKKFLLFAWENHEANGGWGDFEGDFDTVEEAIAYYHANKNTKRRFTRWDNYQVVNSDNGIVIEEF